MFRTNNISRRSFVKKAGAVGVLPLSIRNKDNPKTTKIPEYKNREGVVKYMEVPKTWVQHKNAVEKVADRLSDKLRDKPGIGEVGITAAPEKFSGKRGFQVEVGVVPDEVKTELPDHSSGVPIRSFEYEPNEPLCYNHCYSEVLGGVQIYDKSRGFGGTIGWRVGDSSGIYVITAEHVVPDGEVHQACGGFTSKIGEVRMSNSNMDISVVEITNNMNIEAEISVDENNDKIPIGGWVAEGGIASRVSDWFDQYHAYGRTTGETSGGLDKYHIDDSYHYKTPSYNGHGVRGTANSAKGDSGGPAYDMAGGEAYLTHIVTHGDPKAGEESGNNCDNNNEFKKAIGAATYEIDNHWYTSNK